jgi:hypothetical protein
VFRRRRVRDRRGTFAVAGKLVRNVFFQHRMKVGAAKTKGATPARRTPSDVVLQGCSRY